MVCGLRIDTEARWLAVWCMKVTVPIYGDSNLSPVGESVDVMKQRGVT